MKIVKAIGVLALLVIAYDYYRFRSSMLVVVNYLTNTNFVQYDSLPNHPTIIEMEEKIKDKK